MCDFKMKYQRNLTGHINIKHTYKDRFRCDECYFILTHNNVNMVQHKARENIKAKLIPVKSVIIKPQSEDIYITTSE